MEIQRYVRNLGNPSSISATRPLATGLPGVFHGFNHGDLRIDPLGAGNPRCGEGECNNVISTKYPIQANLRGIEDLW